MAPALGDSRPPLSPGVGLAPGIPHPSGHSTHRGAQHPPGGTAPPPGTRSSLPPAWEGELTLFLRRGDICSELEGKSCLSN